VRAWDSVYFCEERKELKKGSRDGWQHCKIGTVLGGYLWEEEGEWRRWRWRNMVDGLHILIWNRTKKPLAIALSGAGRGLRGRDDGSDLTNVQYKPSQNCHYESPPYNEYILIKHFYNKKREKRDAGRFLIWVVVK
jgi:hypothetical protein